MSYYSFNLIELTFGTGCIELRYQYQFAIPQFNELVWMGELVPPSTFLAYMYAIQ